MNGNLEETMKMKRTIWLSIFALGCAHANADTGVKIYGVVDLGVQYLTNANKAGQSQWSVASGTYLPSRIGFTGNEDLGGGYSAFFTLENGFNADDGSVATTASFFNRFAFVGLGTPAGKLTFGRQGSVQYDKTVFYDPLYYATESQLALNASPIAMFKIPNMVKYQSPSFDGINFELAYGFGQETPGSTVAGRYTGAVLEYEGTQLRARVLREEQRGSITGGVDQSSRVDRRTSAAAAYKAGAMSYFADYTRITGDLQLSPNGNIVTVAAAYQPTSNWRFVGEVGAYHRDSLPGTPKLFNVLVQNFLSKSTSLYAIAGRMINSGGNAYGVLYPAATSLPGQSQVGVTLGIDHRF